ncbi:MAG TPA: cysteine--tRNA ligase [Bacillota bacterium]|nr:cysteine--tRNA ligase [Bacillota bacterium]HPF42042.1 cysteine--tRNA ligase [Bacillota bacterium]HPJ86331.1 cysteine--tRNA ligase [Bacillota bacterium]HRX92303.1 cysteine--tRNA ligase [Candidatus Izemoplasmatales bacterium]
MQIFNTYTNQLEEFVPLKKGEVSIYVCGPTVYNYIHIGNARPVVVFDVVRRYFEYKGYKVKFVSNFTDVDDKIIAKAKQEGKTEKEISERYISQCLSDVQALGSETDYIKPKVTEYMPHIIDYIDELVKLGNAYQKDGDVYFRVSSVPDYGKLSNRRINDLISGARVEVNDLKDSPLDFTLWKKTDTGVKWDSPFSTGRPGWHTECVAMIDDIFHGMIDIHGGGTDLIFPHHENEIAQAEAMHHNHIARYWMHNGRLNLEGEKEKMSKSQGSVVLVKDIYDKAMPFRLLLLSTQYRTPLNYSDDNLNMYSAEWDKIVATINSVHRTLAFDNYFSQQNDNVKSNEVSALMQAFEDAMDQDFNTPNAITSLQALVKMANVELRKKNNDPLLADIEKTLMKMLGILGLDPEIRDITEEDKTLYLQWQKLRQDGNYAEADKIRDILQKRKLL